jgi:hypothetical protein
MRKIAGLKLLLSFFVFLSFFMGNEIAWMGLIFGSFFLIFELMQKKYETAVIFFILMYIYIGLKPIPGYFFQYQESVNQYGEGRGVYNLILPEYAMNFSFGSFDLSLPLIAGLFFCAFLLYNIFLNFQIFSEIPKFLVITFLLLFIPSIIGFLIAASMDINGSLAPTKVLLGLSAVFYGYVFAKTRKEDSYRLLLQLKNKYVYVLAFLLLAGLMYNHILFIYLGVAASIAVYVLLYEKNVIKFIVLVISILIGSYNNTFTIMLIPIFCALITLLSLKLFSLRIRDMLPKLGFVFYITFLFLILSVPKQEVELQEQSDIEGRLYNKIYADRLFIWSSYLKEIKKEPLFLVIPKESISLETIKETERDISYGAHNSLIQLLYFFGVVYGSILFLILFYLINKMIICSKYLPLHVQTIALGLFGVFVVFGLTGHSIVSHAAGLFFWLFVGIILGLGVQMKQDTIENRNADTTV